MNTKFLVLVIVILMALVGLGIAKGWINVKPQKTPTQDVSSSPPERAQVKRIVDPITIELDTGHIVRYIGVRTPSSANQVQCFGKEALLANESMMGKEIRLEEEPLLARSSDGAWTRYVFFEDDSATPSPAITTSPSPTENTAIAPDPEKLTELAQNILSQPDEIIDAETPTPALPAEPLREGVEPTPEEPKEIFVNERILEGGFGFPVVSQDMKYGERMLSAARFASATSKGLWGKCEVKDETGSLQTQAVTDCVIKGKVTPSNEKIYRLPECSAYAATTVLQLQGDQWFCAEDLAQEAGFTKASDCK